MTKISILGWETTGFRCPDHKVDFTQSGSSDVYRVSLLQMPNGTGKTTTLKLIRSALSGRLTSWNNEVAELADEGSPEGRFVIRMGIDARLLTIDLLINFDEEKIRYTTTYGGATHSGFRPPPFLQQIFSSDFVDLFVFDGELANALMDPEKTRAQQAMDAQFQLGILTGISQKLNENWRTYADSVGATETRGLMRRKNRLETLRSRRDILTKKKANLELQEGPARTKLSILHKKYDDLLQNDEKDAVELKRIDEGLAAAERQLAAALGTAIGALRNPQNLSEGFSSSLVALKGSLDVLRLPTSTSKEFFDELKNAATCVCDRPIDEAAKAAIASKAESYLGDDEVGVLNSLKSDISRFASEPSETYLSELNQRMKQVAAAVAQRDRLKTEAAAIEQRRLDAGDIELGNVKQDVASAEKVLQDILDGLDKLNAPYSDNDDDSTESLSAIIGIHKKAEEDYAEITKTLDLKRKTSIACDIVDKVKEIARTKISANLCEDTNSRITGVLKRTPVAVARINESVVLERQSGASAGQILSVGYAFLGSLFGMGSYELPFVVDSPAGPLDDNVRREIATLVPDFTHQFIAFVISSERPNFVENLRKAAGRNVQHVTLFRLTPHTDLMKIEAMKFDAIESSNGILSNSQEYFDRFDDAELEDSRADAAGA